MSFIRRMTYGLSSMTTISNALSRRVHQCSVNPVDSISPWIQPLAFDHVVHRSHCHLLRHALHRH
ncbi:unnamed protein product [Gongylonema pulchrum]|uniref:Uncharacterized protein n=1 Tax=Gongylonema pulchrum TaxID=637853 RepID=A0A3P6UMK9_9BILA|nr:unnamed protein product [Gongylonema pulchrum]